MKDLIILAADKNAHFAMRGALQRHEALGIRPVVHEFRTHPGRDGGARTTGAQMLSLERRRFAHALLVFDLAGSGANRATAVSLEIELDRQLAAHWGVNAKAIVIDPEVDIWLWGAENVLRDVFRWPVSQDKGIREWLTARGFEFHGNGKPLKPKEALEALQPVHKMARSSSLYEKVTARISLQRCGDPSFLRMRAALQAWFGN